jgi:hypothetical protein
MGGRTRHVLGDGSTGRSETCRAQEVKTSAETDGQRNSRFSQEPLYSTLGSVVFRQPKGSDNDGPFYFTPNVNHFGDQIREKSKLPLQCNSTQTDAEQTIPIHAPKFTRVPFLSSLKKPRMTRINTDFCCDQRDDEMDLVQLIAGPTRMSPEIVGYATSVTSYESFTILLITTINTNFPQK